MTGTARMVVAAAIGAVFALGLGVSGMADPGNILGFLDLTGGAWDPTLMFVMAGAILVHAPFVRIARGRPRPWRAERFAWPTATQLDARLVGGAALFGVGWGLSGYCPGPALVGAASLYPYALVFVAALVVGTAIGAAVTRDRTGTQKK
jgi:uncharacterized protein